MATSYGVFTKERIWRGKTLLWLIPLVAAVPGGIFVPQIPERVSWIVVTVILLLVGFAADFANWKQDMQRGDDPSLVKVLEKRIAKMESFLRRLHTTSGGQFEESFRATHSIPLEGVESCCREATLTAEHRTLWRSLVLTTTESGLDLEVKKAEHAGKKMDWLQVAQGDTRVLVFFILNEALEAGQTTNWMLEYSRPGTWDVARQSGDDWVSVKPQNPCKKAEILLNFIGWPNEPELLRKHPNVGYSTMNDIGNNTRQIKWSAKDLEEERTYELHFRCEP